MTAVHSENSCQINTLMDKNALLAQELNKDDFEKYLQFFLSNTVFFEMVLWIAITSLMVESNPAICQKVHTQSLQKLNGLTIFVTVL